MLTRVKSEPTTGSCESNPEDMATPIPTIGPSRPEIASRKLLHAPMAEVIGPSLWPKVLMKPLTALLMVSMAPESFSAILAIPSVKNGHYGLTRAWGPSHQ